jgi:hypothetical protein
MVAGTATHYGEFVKLCRARIADLEITFDTVDAICGFPSGYTGKLMCGDKAMSVYSFFTIARALALSPVFEADEAQLAMLRRRGDWIASRRNGVRSKKGGGITRFQNHVDFYRQIGRKGGIARALLLKRRRAQTAKARAARWNGNGHAAPK